jgi:REP element-mobilizing transposase RayT
MSAKGKSQVEMAFRTHGGKRKGAGRPPKGPRSSERHETRPVLKASQPVHVVMRIVADVGSLRKRHLYKALREATATSLRRRDFRIVHVSIQATHVHAIVEADDRVALARGMQGFQISAARHINTAISKRTGEPRRGKVFADRYHARILKTPREVRNAIAYVLNNWRHHDEDRAAFARSWKIDPYSSASQFGGWKELEDSAFLFPRRATYDPLWVWLPRTWLLKTGWRQHGLIQTAEIPGGRHTE